MAGIDDDAGFFPGLEEALASGSIVELEDEVVEVFDLVEQGGGVGLDFLEEGGAVDDLAARDGEERGELLDGCAEGGDAGGADSASGGSWLADGYGGDVADGGGLGDQIAVAESDDVALGEVDLAATVEIADFLEVDGEGACEDVRSAFEAGFGEGLGIGTAASGGFRLGVFGGNGAVGGGDEGEIRAEIGRFFAVPRGFVIGALSDGDAGTDHVELVL